MKTLAIATVLLLVAMRVTGQQLFLNDGNGFYTNSIHASKGMVTVFTEYGHGQNPEWNNFVSVNTETGEIIPGISFADNDGVRDTINIGSKSYAYGKAMGLEEIINGIRVPILTVTGGGNQNHPSQIRKSLAFKGSIYSAGWFKNVVQNGTTIVTGGIFKVDTATNKASNVPLMETSIDITDIEVVGNKLWMIGSDETKGGRILKSFDGTVTEEIPFQDYAGITLNAGTISAIEIAGDTVLVIVNEDEILVYDFISPMYQIPSESLGGGFSSLLWDKASKKLYLGGNFKNPYTGKITSFASVDLVTQEWEFIGGSYNGFPLTVDCLAQDSASGKIYMGGNYDVRVYDPNFTGVATLPTINILVGPNPFTEYINISCPSYQEGGVRIYDLAGRLVHNEHFSGVDLQINASNLERGVYFIQVCADNQVRFSTKIVKL